MKQIKINQKSYRWYDAVKNSLNSILTNKESRIYFAIWTIGPIIVAVTAWVVFMNIFESFNIYPRSEADYDNERSFLKTSSIYAIIIMIYAIVGTILSRSFWKTLPVIALIFGLALYLYADFCYEFSFFEF